MNTLLKNATLIDGTGSLLIENAIIAIRQGKIHYAGPANGWMNSSDDWIELD